MAAAYLAGRLGVLVGLLCQSGRSKSLPVSNPAELPKSAPTSGEASSSTKSACQLKLAIGLAVLLTIACQVSAFRSTSTPVASNLRQRWISLNGPRAPDHNINNPSSLIARIQRRIGARNSIRVHNAFRDLAWRLLASLSMPTPVIYELRRQHLYSPDEDARNDNLFDRNTTKTIRIGRRATGRIDEDGDEDEQEVGGRMRVRTQAALENLMNLSRRSLFGRVIRLPSLLPFKRQERQQDTSEEAKPRKVLVRFRRNRKRRNKEPDRQMIFINGKQYYINDDGELVEQLKPKKI